MLQTQLSRHLLIINSAGLLACAVFSYSFRDTLLLLLLLFLPFLDRAGSFQLAQKYKNQLVLNLTVIALIAVICLIRPQAMDLIPAVFFLTALPEEWFFRAYFMQRIEALYGSPLKANLISSAVFTVLHLPVQGLMGLSVFLPSLLFGWLYQQKKDFLLVVLLHLLFNLVFIVLVKYWLVKILM
ncbi:hypothetical protein MNBD_GAMMA11-769 [hydrothermal vent metagenome]|uniref:CAAX prenyl protease 2/Lysostaphin resistance protein A-like domain-containing protein n=1 Tax=hydrothermal vent metagenome TaxID=652676 RepID=A0A3B0X1Y4_9ZZZZ